MKVGMDGVIKAKLEKLQVTTTQVVGSEMGWVFTVIAPKGVCVEDSMRYANWPLYRFPGISREIHNQILHALENNPFSFSSLDGTPLKAFVQQIEQTVEDEGREDSPVPGGRGPSAPAWLASLRSAILRSVGELYAFGLAFWDTEECEIEFFPSATELVEYFVRQLEFVSWDDMKEEEIEDYLEQAENPGVVFWVPSSDGDGFEAQRALCPGACTGNAEIS